MFSQKSRIRCQIVSAASLMTAFIQPVSAQEILKELDPLVVAAEKALEQQRLSSPVPLVGATAEELDKTPSLQLGDQLKYLPGVYLSGNINENDDLQLRGLPKAYSRVQIGGIQIPDAAGEAREFQINRLPKGLFKEAKIIRNPTAEYESDGIGGRLALETIDIPQKFQGDLHAGFGARDRQAPLWDTSAMAGGRFNDWSGLLGALSFGRDPSLKTKLTNDYLANGTIKKGANRIEDTGIDTYGAFLDAGLFYENGELHVKPMFLRREIDKHSRKDGIDFTKAANKDESYEDDREQRTEETLGFTASSLHRWSDTARQESLFSYYGAFQEMPFSSAESFKESGGGFVYDGREDESWSIDDRTAEFQTKTIFDFNTPLRQQLKFGMAARTRTRDSNRRYSETDNVGVVTDLTTAADDYKLTEDYLAGFVQDQVWLTEKFSVLPGLRAEYSSLESRDGAGVKASRDMTDLNPTLHFLYQQSPGLAYHLGFSRTVNRPQFDQLSPFRRINDDDERVEIGNPDLDPATSLNIDLGVDWSHGPLFLGANVFYKEIKDVIQQELIGTTLVGGLPYDLYQANNVGDGSLKGIELDQRFSFSTAGITGLAGLELWANESIYSSELEFRNGTKSPFEEQPEFIANVGIDYTVPRTGTLVSLSGNFVGEFQWSESDGTKISYAPEWIVNLAVRQKVNENLEFFVETINLLDEERLETETKTNGEFRKEYITSGRTVMAGLNYRF